jgi:hypothetical protein
VCLGIEGFAKVIGVLRSNEAIAHRLRDENPDNCD